MNVIGILLSDELMFLVAITMHLPMSLATKKMAKKYEQRRKRHAGITEYIGEEFDLFSRDRAFLAVFIVMNEVHHLTDIYRC